MRIERIGVVGGGLMGSGIAESAAAAGVAVTLIEPTVERLEQTQERLERSVAGGARRGKIDDPQAVLGRIAYETDPATLAGAEMVIEAVTEDVELKQRIFAELATVTGEDAVLASNTSSIPIAELAAVTDVPGRVLGLHFFSPVPAMKLVEIVIALDTSEWAEARAAGLAEQMGKRAIRTKDRSGFVVNMLLVPYLMAAIRMHEEGFADAEDIDVGMKLGCGHPMGPLALSDLIGIDVLYAVGNSLFDEFKRDEYAPPPLMKRMVAANRLGRKTGRGFYDYD